ncbi:MAG: hypothetical protein JRG80_07135, partial [Deltaproteobacteria bacterium]|nr:hypothetical protein [Deltaproteobacteria bacterium]
HYAAYTKPGVPTGGHYRRRPGRRVESGRIFAAGAESRGIANHPYADDPPVRIEFGRYGFRSEFPPLSGGTAIIGASYVEAAFADAGDTIPGWLNRDHGIRAANFGIAFSGGFTALHVLERYVIPTHPAEVVWVFSGRGAFERLVTEGLALRRHPEPDVVITRPGFVPLLHASVLARMQASTLAIGAGLRIVYLPSRFEMFAEHWLKPPARRPERPDFFALVEAECGWSRA